ncbi:MAG: DAK2 domain-containing protein [Clostridia bacterium]|nr:DAK2 domain-containing protein [Clostridia bacterium]
MINGTSLKNAIISAANNIDNSKTAVDALNVFPVPDGDTGTNMSMTMRAAARELAILPDGLGAGEVAGKAASALLRGARGNSGVILSLIFRGFSKALKDHTEIDAKTLAKALEEGAKSAYGAVMKPTEGTILTVIRESGEAAAKLAAGNIDAVELWEKACKVAKESLDRTPELLPQLKKAGVVDAGGQGLLLVMQGMLSVFKGEGIIDSGDNPVTPVQTVSAAATVNEDIKFGYCTEFIVNRVNPEPTDAAKLRAYLETIGDCVVVVDDDEIIKVHVHSNDPGNAIQAGLKYGALVNIKIDNMRYQHSNNVIEQEQLPAADDAPQVAEIEKQFGFVAVCAGEGFEEMFNQLGADRIVSGGQTMNPSTDDILRAVLATPAEHVFILPNNKNIIMAAEQVVPLCEKGISVLHTKTVPQGIAAMLSFDETQPAEKNHLEMMKAASNVCTGLVTFAARDSEVNNQHVRKGQILGMEDGKITVLEHDPIKAGYKVARRLYKKLGASMITIYYGADSTEEQAQELSTMIASRCHDAEIAVIPGGQPIYYFTIAVE